MGKREELFKLKAKYWLAGDYRAVKKVRIAIKELDAEEKRREEAEMKVLFGKYVADVK